MAYSKMLNVAHGAHGLLTAGALLLLTTHCCVCAELAEGDLGPAQPGPDAEPSPMPRPPLAREHFAEVKRYGCADLTERVVLPSAAADLELKDGDLQGLAAYLWLLLREGGEGAGPLVYEEAGEGGDGDYPLGAAPWKRSRYYRRYPWKRQNARGRGAASADDNRYMCNPSREDVFQLLVALHAARAGDTRRTVSFCNRRRPASAIFTNIRFLGRRRK
ncbi:uncharacterized protein LOC134538433 [Bacillus rossius redtenbacheri]|uniref:uncharacterized protein LOC134538433 n=1 Tax=Bacillus rossius redtenbacheri TaxID=93214 RepID=UPI002FDDE4A2